MRSSLIALIVSAVLISYIVAQPASDGLEYMIDVGESCPYGYMKSHTLGDTTAKCTPSGFTYEDPFSSTGPAESDYHCAIPKGIFNATDVGLGGENPCRCEYIPSDKLLSCYCKNGSFEIRIDDN